MKHLTKIAMGLMFAAAASSASAAVLYTTDFETNQSSNFTVSTTSADTEANFAFDYSTYVPQAATVGVTSIGAAPSAAGTKGLKLRANFDVTGTSEGVGAFINAGAGKAAYTLTFDAYQMWNGPADVSGTGTTTTMTFGNATTTAAPYFGNTTFTGFIVAFTGEGGSGTDARYYEGNASAATLNNTLANWLGAAAINMEAAAGPWLPIFANPNYPEAGTPGRQWATWKLEVNSGTVTISVKPLGASSFTVVSGPFAATAPTGNTPFVGFMDPFTGSVADPVEDNFVIIDNLTLSEPDVTSAENWSLYN